MHLTWTSDCISLLEEAKIPSINCHIIILEYTSSPIFHSVQHTFICFWYCVLNMSHCYKLLTIWIYLLFGVFLALGIEVNSGRCTFGIMRSCACVCYHFSHIWLFATPWTVAYQAPLSMVILQARVLEWVAMSSSRGSSWPRDWTWVSYVSCSDGNEILGTYNFLYLIHIWKPLMIKLCPNFN